MCKVDYIRQNCNGLTKIRDFYMWAFPTDELGKDIKEEEIISVYGIDAQYNYMPEAICWPILKEVLEKK